MLDRLSNGKSLILAAFQGLYLSPCAASTAPHIWHMSNRNTLHNVVNVAVCLVLWLVFSGDMCNMV